MPIKPVFISYVHEDIAIVDRLKNALAFNGFSVWIDHERLEPGTPDWGEAIEYGLPQCQALIYIASPKAKNSRFVIHELEIANRWKIPIVPFWIAGEEWIDVAPFGWPRLQYIDARAELADYGDAFSELLKVLRKKAPLNEPIQTQKTAKPSDSSHFETQPEIEVVPVISPLVTPTISLSPTPGETPSLQESVLRVRSIPPMEPTLQDTPPKREDGGHKWLRPVVITLIAVLLLSGISAAFLTSHLRQPGTVSTTPTIAPTQRPSHWTAVGSSNPGSHINVLYSVDAITSDDVWAAGYYRNSPSTTSKFTLLEHWDGSSWKQINSPNSGANINVLNGIEALGPNDVWAVGDADSSSLIEHWDGSSWVQKTSPNVGTAQNYLNAVAASAANDIWTVGSSRGTPNDSDRALIQHWDGSSWQVTPSPNLGSGNNILYSVTALTSDNAWAAGFYRDTSRSPARPLIEHWNGSSWQVIQALEVSSGDNVFRSIAAMTLNDIWAVGYSETTGQDAARSLIEHWDGSSWTVVTSPNPSSGYNNLYSVTALTSKDVWAVGVGPLIVHWDGSSWQPVANQGFDPTRNILNSISAMDANDIWAVGVFGGAGQTSSNYALIEHWTSS